MTDSSAGSSSISVSHGKLEALWERPEQDTRAVAVLCHPHPQYGGSMHTKALYHLARVLNDLGVATLRFNFRGVGASTGSFDDGDGERDDVRAALEFVRGKEPELPLILAGFSFGSVMGLHVARETDDVDALIALGLPVSLADVRFLNDETRPLLILQGENDRFATVKDVREAIVTDRDGLWLREITGTGHLFGGEFEQLKREVRMFFEEGPGRKTVTGAE